MRRMNLSRLNPAFGIGLIPLVGVAAWNAIVFVNRVHCRAPLWCSAQPARGGGGLGALPRSQLLLFLKTGTGTRAVAAKRYLVWAPTPDVFVLSALCFPCFAYRSIEMVNDVHLNKAPPSVATFPNNIAVLHARLLSR